VAFEEIVRRFRRVELAGEPVSLPSMLVRGLVRVPLAFAS
jgi:hypothetical protein